MLLKLVLFTLASVISFDAYCGPLRSRNEVFSEPAKGGIAQTLLGLSQLGLARGVWPGLEREELAVAEARKELELTRRLPTSESEKIARMEANARAIVAADKAPVKVQVLPANPAVPSLQDELDFIARNDVVSAEAKAARIAAAEAELAKRMEVALEAAQRIGILERTLRIVRKGAALLLIADVGARIYVWNGLDANPGLTPIGAYSAAQIKAFLE